MADQRTVMKRELKTVEDYKLGMRFLSLSAQRAGIENELKGIAASLGLPADIPIAFDGKTAFAWTVNKEPGQ